MKFIFKGTDKPGHLLYAGANFVRRGGEQYTCFSSSIALAPEGRVSIMHSGREPVLVEESKAPLLLSNRFSAQKLVGLMSEDPQSGRPGAFPSKGIESDSMKSCIELPRNRDENCRT